MPAVREPTPLIEIGTMRRLGAVVSRSRRASGSIVGPYSAAVCFASWRSRLRLAGGGVAGASASARALRLGALDSTAASLGALKLDHHSERWW